MNRMASSWSWRRAGLSAVGCLILGVLLILPSAPPFGGRLLWLSAFILALLSNLVLWGTSRSTCKGVDVRPWACGALAMFSILPWAVLRLCVSSWDLDLFYGVYLAAYGAGGLISVGVLRKRCRRVAVLPAEQNPTEVEEEKDGR